MTPQRNRLGAAALAVAGLLFLPQSFTPAAGRVTHGVLPAAGCVLLVAVLWRAAGGQTRSAVTVTGNSRSAKRAIA